ncbi:uncharacterized protein LOC128501337 [Spea bombifrons]|uniref:uncharacterized protein LOC128501337 n=1 Tax=Spea bombifrons TaxID=233779 RepID=UPI00234BA687|nr:uncharacterized protein LOC128501337 [Spea bombifrons]
MHCIAVTLVLVSTIHLSTSASNDAAKTLCPKMICGSTSMNVSFQIKDLVSLDVDIQNIHLRDKACFGVQISESTLSVVSQLQDCKTQLSTNKTHATYQNTVYLPPDPSLVIYREEYFVDVSCSYPLDMNVSSGTTLYPTISTIYIKVDGSGEFKVTMALFEDAGFSTPYKRDTIALSTKDMLYVGVYIEGDTPDFDLVMVNCFATPTQSFYDPVRYNLIRNSCPNEQEKTLTVASNGISKKGQFSVQMFKFIGNYSYVYLHCEVHLCENSVSCLPICDRPRSRRSNPESSTGVLSLGPISYAGLTQDSGKLCPILTCGSSHINVTFHTKDLQSVNVDTEHIHLIDRSCRAQPDGVNNAMSLGWELKEGECGTSLIKNATHVTYKNLIYLPPDPVKIIYREEYYVNVSCSYSLDMNVSLWTVLRPILSKTYLSIAGSGQFQVMMSLFQDPGYLRPFQQGCLSVSTSETLYIGVFVAEGDILNFDLVMVNCFATPTNNFYDTVRYNLIQQSCPNEKEKTLHVASNGISSQGQFSVRMFKFIGNYPYVYLHCEVHLCRRNGMSCLPVCPQFKSRNSGSESKTGQLSIGPITYKGLSQEPQKLCPNLTCGSSLINVTFQTRDLQTVDTQNIHLHDKSCYAHSNSEDTISLAWELKEGACGTSLTTNVTHATYKNLIYLPPNPADIIYRDELFVNVSCTYPLDMNVSLWTVLRPVLRQIYISIEGMGEFKVIMALFQDPAYRIPYEVGSLSLSTEEMLYVGVFIAEGDVSHFYLVMKNCFATPTNTVYDAVRYYIIQNSCPNKKDQTINVAANGISSQGQFSIKMFKFIGDNIDTVYLHCEVHLCQKTSTTSCLPSCSRLDLASRGVSPISPVLTLGPISRSDIDPETTVGTDPGRTAATTSSNTKDIRTSLDFLALTGLVALGYFL